MALLTSAQMLAKEYDVIVVGSGAAGGMSAYVLAKRGVKVLLLEAGRNYDPQVETAMFEDFSQAPLRGIPTRETPMGAYDASIGGFEIEGEPYVVKNLNNNTFANAVDESLSDASVRQNFTWFRSRMLGGRTNHWGRTSLRFGSYDFKPKSRDGLGFDWPLDYNELSPYYDEVDKLVGIIGTKENLENNPDSDFFLPPPKPRAMDLLIGRAAAKMNLRMIPKRAAILTKPLNDRSPCFYATDCHRGCSIGAAFQSPSALIIPALETNCLDVLTDAMVREILIDDKGRAKGVLFIDKKANRELRALGKSVILAGGALESTRLLLNSKGPRFPNGIGNSTGHLGKWIMDTPVANHAHKHIPKLMDLPPFNEDGISISHSYIPWVAWRDLAAGKFGFPRAYYMTWNGGRTMPNFKNVQRLMEYSGAQYGTKLKEEARRYFGSFFSFYTPGEMIPNKESFCEIDPEVKDRWGIPVLRMHFAWSEYEIKQMEHQMSTVNTLVEAIGGKGKSRPIVPRPGGADNHEVGGARMSLKPEDGVCNKWGQIWDCQNVVVADGGSFVSNPCKNPTLTIMALAWRASEHLVTS